MDILVGLQWGDEGKGKFIDKICSTYDLVARFNGGANAGHSIYYNEQKITLKLLPSGIFVPTSINIIGTGVVVNPTQLRKEIEEVHRIDANINLNERLILSEKAHLVLPTYKYFDLLFEEHPAFRTIGTTKNGIAPAYSNKILRQNLRIGDIFKPQFTEELKTLLTRQYQELLQYNSALPELEILLSTFLEDIHFLKQLIITDTEIYINQAIKEGKKVLAEGAQATMLDIDQGTYPYVTSSNTIAGAACTGLGVSPLQIGTIFGVSKAYTTRVGKGVFPTEIEGEQADELREKGHEFGSNTKRPRRIGWLDLPALRYAVMVNGITELIITKGDILNGMKQVPLCTAYHVNGKQLDYFAVHLEEKEIEPIYQYFEGWNADFSKIKDKNHLPSSFITYLNFVEKEIGVPITYISTGPEREAIIHSNVS